jgi:hypothetical protein
MRRSHIEVCSMLSWKAVCNSCSVEVTRDDHIQKSAACLVGRPYATCVVSR